MRDDWSSVNHLRLALRAVSLPVPRAPRRAGMVNCAIQFSLTVWNRQNNEAARVLRLSSS